MVKSDNEIGKYSSLTTQRNCAISIFMLIVFFALCKVYFKKVFSHKEVLSSEFTIHTQCQYNGNVLSNVHNNHCNVCTMYIVYLSRKMAVDGYNAQCSRTILMFGTFVVLQNLHQFRTCDGQTFQNILLKMTILMPDSC